MFDLRSFKKCLILTMGLVVVHTSSVNAAVRENSKDIQKNEADSKVSAQKKKLILENKLSEEEVAQLKADAKILKEKWSTNSTLPVTLSTSKRLERTQKYWSEGNFGRALEIIDPVITRPSSNDLEVAKALVLKSQILMTMQDFSSAEQALTLALKKGSLGYAEQTEALLMLAQNQFTAKKFKDAKKNLVQFIEVSPKKSGQAYVMLATIENELDNLEDASKYIDEALANDEKHQEAWMYFGASIYSKNGEFEKAEKVLRKLVTLSQKNKNYWMSLVSALFEQEKFTDALVYLEMAQKLGFVKSNTDIVNRSAMFAQEKVPYKAALILENALSSKDIEPTQKIYEFMASFWFVAKEYKRSIEAYKKASALAEDGSVELLLGQVYLEQEDWESAKKSFQTALRRGNLKKRAGNAILGLGMTSYYQEDREGALKYFEQAKKFKQLEEAADNWISFLN